MSGNSDVPVQQKPTTVGSPLSPVSSRFPLGPGRFGSLASQEKPSEPGVRPFGLRFATVPNREPLPELPSWRFDPHQQIAIVDDGTAEPWYRKLAADGTMNTTGPSKDGTGNTGGEEWTPDFAGDVDQ